jgi:hypothetical protein
MKFNRLSHEKINNCHIILLNLYYPTTSLKIIINILILGIIFVILIIKLLD